MRPEHRWARGPSASGGPEAGGLWLGRRALGEPEGGGPEGRPPTALRSAFIIDSFQRNKIKIITCAGVARVMHVVYDYDTLYFII